MAPSAARPAARGPDGLRVRTVLRLVRRRAGLLLAGALVGVALGALGSLLLPAAYTSTAVVVVAALPSDPLTGGSTSARDISTATEIRVVSSTSVADRVPALLDGVRAPGDLLSGLSVSSPPASQLIDVSYTASSARVAAGVANAFADAYLAYRVDATVQRNRDVIGVLNQRIVDLTTLQGQLPADPAGATATSGSAVSRASLTQEVAELRRQVAQLGGNAVTAGQVVDRASAAGSPSSSLLRLLVLVGLVLGALCGLALALWHDSRADRVQDDLDLAEQAQAPTLLSLPAPRPGQGPDEEELRQAYRLLAVKLTAPHVSGGAASFLVVDLSPAPEGTGSGGTGSGGTGSGGTGSGGTAAAVAEALAEGGRSVAFLAAPTVPSPARAPAPEPAPVEAAAGTGGTSAELVPGARGAALSGVEGLQALQQAAQDFDQVVVDGTGVTASELLSLGLAVDAVLLTATAARTRRSQVRSLAVQFEQVGVPVVGTVLHLAAHGRTVRALEPVRAPTGEEPGREHASVLP